MAAFGMFFILIRVPIIWEYWVCENSLWPTYDGLSFPCIYRNQSQGVPKDKVFIWAYWKKEKVTATNQNILLKSMNLQWSSRKKRNSTPKRTKKYLWSPFKERSQVEWYQYCQFSLDILSISPTWGRSLVIFITGKREQTSTVLLYQNWALFLFFQFLPTSYLLTG